MPEPTVMIPLIMAATLWAMWTVLQDFLEEEREDEEEIEDPSHWLDVCDINEHWS